MRLWLVLLGMVLLVWGLSACGAGFCSGIRHIIFNIINFKFII